MEIKHKGEELTLSERKEILDHLYFSKHARERLEQRLPVCIDELIMNPKLAYFNTDGSVNIAADDYNYLVVAYNEKYKNWTVVTWKEKSWHPTNTIFEKQRLAQKGADRADYNKGSDYTYTLGSVFKLQGDKK